MHYVQEALEGLVSRMPEKCSIGWDEMLRVISLVNSNSHCTLRVREGGYCKENRTRLALSVL